MVEVLPEPSEQRLDDPLPMKKVLILVLSTEKDWYGRLAETSQATWDSIEVGSVETIFYFATSKQPSTDKILFTDSDDDFWSMGKKTLAAFDYALANRQFDYVFRANASLYVDKAGLLKYVQDKPGNGLALGVLAPGSRNGEQFLYMWGPGYLLSRDVVQLVVNNKEQWDHTVTDDNAISLLLHQLGIPLDNRGSMASIALRNGGYEFVFYGSGIGGGVTMKTLGGLRETLPDQFAFRVKDDADRNNDIRLMRELHAAFQSNDDFK